MSAITPGTTNRMPAARPPRAVQEPSEVDGELLRFRSRQQMTKVQRMQKPRSRNPMAYVDNDPCNTAIWPAGPPKLIKPMRSQTFQRLAEMTPAKDGLIGRDPIAAGLAAAWRRSLRVVHDLVSTWS